MVKRRFCNPWSERHGVRPVIGGQHAACTAAHTNERQRSAEGRVNAGTPFGHQVIFDNGGPRNRCTRRPRWYSAKNNTMSRPAWAKVGKPPLGGSGYSGYPLGTVPGMPKCGTTRQSYRMSPLLSARPGSALAFSARYPRRGARWPRYVIKYVG